MDTTNPLTRLEVSIVMKIQALSSQISHHIVMW